MRRLFSTFAVGLPGAGLLVMRLAASIVLIATSISTLSLAASLAAGSPPIAAIALPAVQFILALLLLVGLWTPFAGFLVALIELSRLLLQAGDRWEHLLLASLGLALALLGPGVWSIDARLFGWRRIDLRDRPSRAHPFKG